MKNNNILILKNIPASIWMYTPYSLHFFLSICSSHSEVADKKEYILVENVDFSLGGKMAQILAEVFIKIICSGYTTFPSGI